MTDFTDMTDEQLTTYFIAEKDPEMRQLVLDEMIRRKLNTDHIDSHFVFQVVK